MKAAVLHKVGNLRYEDFPVPYHGKGWALIKVKAVGLCGSDIPRIFETGTYIFPLIPGHEFSGEIVRVGRAIPCLRRGVKGNAKLREGDRVTVFPLIPCKRCRYCKMGFFSQCKQYDYLGSRRHGAMAEYVEVPKQNIFLLPRGVSFAEAALTEPAAVALHALYKLKTLRGKTMALFGCGTIGLILAQLARIKGIKKIFLIDIDEARLKKAREIGFRHTINSKKTNVVNSILKITEREGVEIVIEGAGVSATYNQAIAITAKLGKIIFLGNPLEDVVLKKDFVSRILRGEITIQGTWNSMALSTRKNEWKEVLGYMAKGKLKTTLLAKTFPLEEINKVLERVREGGERRKPIFLP
ncbi:MAG: galactitol-1-phosphate 5-dehydrogenase [Candidatus Omnitrophica bacterium]|nr:galactitol-1-phosphate 5-dehydrogenase [Candidatus Omnitrophota bacterium]